MRLYFEFESKRRLVEVEWPKSDNTITVHLTDKELTRHFPTDLLFEIDQRKKVKYIVESPDDKRLIELQDVIAYRLQEFVTKS